MITRRHFALSAPGFLGSALAASGCSSQSGGDDYDSLATETWHRYMGPNLAGTALSQELIRNATLAPSSHNTQCWKFKIEDSAITVFPDPARRCPAVDPDDHHVFVSLGCAIENLAQAAMPHGLHADARLNVGEDAIRVTLTATRTQATSLVQAIALRQCTRGDYDGTSISNEDLNLLATAGSSSGVRLQLLTERTAINRVRDFVIEANTRQMADPAFVRELKSWIRFNGAQAVRTRDGLFSLASGSPAIPTWLGELALGIVFTPKGENEKYARQIGSSAGIAIFVGQAADKAHWVDVGRCYERFALQATALGIRNAFLNQPVEVPGIRSSFAGAIGLGAQRPDLVVRFGRGPAMPRSLRRTVQSVLV
jgi:hypothetical protein